MISTPTVLIVGAGGSAPFGFPVGRKLLQIIILTMSNEHSKEYKHVLDYLASEERKKISKPSILDVHKKAKELISLFVNHLDKSQLSSIDAFLEKRKEFVDVGKAAIAAVLIPFEEPLKFSRKPNVKDPEQEDQTWYEYVLNYLTKRDLAYFKGNKLSVITFNYDRSLEFCFSNALESTYNLSSKGSKQLLSEVIPFVHVYGSLGELWGNVVRSYSTYCSNKTLEIASSGIKVMDTTRENTEEFQKAHQLIEEAKKLVFVGFGFDPTNLERLKIHDHFTGQEIYATAYGLEEEEIDKRIYSPLYRQDPNFHLNIDRTGSMATKALHKLMPFED